MSRPTSFRIHPAVALAVVLLCAGCAGEGLALLVDNCWGQGADQCKDTQSRVLRALGHDVDGVQLAALAAGVRYRILTEDGSGRAVMGAGTCSESEELQVELHHALLFEGDSFLVCSDGLTKHVSNDEIRAHLLAVTAGEAVELAARSLVELANERGGTDNVTCVVARF